MGIPDKQAAIIMGNGDAWEYDGEGAEKFREEYNRDFPVVACGCASPATHAIHRASGGHFVRCSDTKCFTRTPLYEEPADAARMWNRIERGACATPTLPPSKPMSAAGRGQGAPHPKGETPDAASVPRNLPHRSEEERERLDLEEYAMRYEMGVVG